VEHYQIASHTTARNLVNQLRLPEVSRLLQMTLPEEQNTDLLLDQIQRPLTSMLGRLAAIMCIGSCLTSRQARQW
jgi:ferritin-like metal-binding protein YciE